MPSPTHDLTVIAVPLDQIERHPENANNGDSAALQESIAINGFYSPLIVQRATGFILAGNHRWEALVKLNADTAPVIYLDVDDSEARRIMLADNRITRLGNDDPAQLLDLLEDLAATDAGLHGSGFTMDDLGVLLAQMDEPLEFDQPDYEEENTSPASGFIIEPLASTDGLCREFLITRPVTYKTDQFKVRDLNAIRKLLGMPGLSDDEIIDSGIENWSTY